MRLPEVIVRERDSRIYDARVQGMNFRQIARALDISPSTAHDGYMRELRRQAKRSAGEAHDIAWLTLDQLDQLLYNLWPITRPHKIKTPDGDEIDVPANMDAIDRVLKIIAQKAKIYGLERDTLMIEHSGDSGAVVSMGDNAPKKEQSTDQLGTDFALELIKHGVISGEVAKVVEKYLTHQDIEDAEVISDTEDDQETPMLFNEPPPFDDDEDEYENGWWIPDDMESGSSLYQDEKRDE